MARLRKFGQADAVGVSVFLLLLALFILLFTILLPEEERAELLGTTPEGEETTSTAAVPKQVILSEIPGKVHTYTQNLQTFNIDPMHLYSRATTETISVIKSLKISRNLLKDNYKVVAFDLPDSSGVEELSLNFLVTESKGEISIKLNNKLFFEGALASNQMPLALPIAYLKDENKLELSVNMPTSDIFSSNYYIIQDVVLVKNAKQSNRKDTRTLYLDPNYVIRSAKLSYFISCNLETQGIFTINLNGQKVLEDGIFCEYPDQRSITINPSTLSKSGKNTITFEVNDGDYNIDQLSLKLELGKSSHPRYYFNIEPEVYDALQNNKRKLMLRLNFKGEGTKKASVTVQDTEIYFDTTAQSYSKEITHYVDNGANYLLIVPKADFEITGLKVVLE